MSNPLWTFKGSIDASDLGLSPGEWPEIVSVTCPDGKIRLFTQRDREIRDGDLLWVTYEREPLAGGHFMEIQVIND